jgi:hypothetical protein
MPKSLIFDKIDKIVGFHDATRHATLRNISISYSRPFPCLTVVGRERGAGTSSTQIVVRARE